MHHSHYSQGICGIVSISSVECDRTWKRLTPLSALMTLNDFERDWKSQQQRDTLQYVSTILITFSIQRSTAFVTVAETHAWDVLKDVSGSSSIWSSGSLLLWVLLQTVFNWMCCFSRDPKAKKYKYVNILKTIHIYLKQNIMRYWKVVIAKK